MNFVWKLLEAVDKTLQSRINALKIVDEKYKILYDNLKCSLEDETSSASNVKNINVSTIDSVIEEEDSTQKHSQDIEISSLSGLSQDLDNILIKAREIRRAGDKNKAKKNSAKPVTKTIKKPPSLIVTEKSMKLTNSTKSTTKSVVRNEILPMKSERKDLLPLHKSAMKQDYEKPQAQRQPEPSPPPQYNIKVHNNLKVQTQFLLESNSQNSSYLHKLIRKKSLLLQETILRTQQFGRPKFPTSILYQVLCTSSSLVSNQIHTHESIFNDSDNGQKEKGTVIDRLDYMKTENTVILDNIQHLNEDMIASGPSKSSSVTSTSTNNTNSTKKELLQLIKNLRENRKYFETHLSGKLERCAANNSSGKNNIK